MPFTNNCHNSIRSALWCGRFFCGLLVCFDERVASRSSGEGPSSDMDLMDMTCWYGLDVLPCEHSNASVRNFPSDATLNAESGAAKSARGAAGSATSLSPSRRERGGAVLAGGEGEGWTGSGSRAIASAAQPPQAGGRTEGRLWVGWRGRCKDTFHCDSLGRGQNFTQHRPSLARQCVRVAVVPMVLRDAHAGRFAVSSDLSLLRFVFFACSGGFNV